MQFELDINYRECQVYSWQLRSAWWPSPGEWSAGGEQVGAGRFLTFQTINFPFFRYLLGEELRKKSKQT